jgi:hypothetical protein
MPWVEEERPLEDLLKWAISSNIITIPTVPILSTTVINRIITDHHHHCHRLNNRCLLRLQVVEEVGVAVGITRIVIVQM